ncbi:hypothetical protein [Microlunatus kandeliicorticis]|uniref:hypothetical protein n=1 Tax=Microlunatus kandeliicorticis TaxID=1759536 RepID=UPI0015FD993D|nr:hypothetical protein [Microlunatus kandeliicorticis]
MSRPERRTGPAATAEPAPEVDPHDRLTHDRTPLNGLDQAINNAAEDWWTKGAKRALQLLADTGRGFTIDSLRDAGVGEPSAPQHWGALIAGAQRSGQIELVGCRIAADVRRGSASSAATTARPSDRWSSSRSSPSNPDPGTPSSTT